MKCMYTFMKCKLPFLEFCKKKKYRKHTGQCYDKWFIVVMGNVVGESNTEYTWFFEVFLMNVVWAATLCLGPCSKVISKIINLWICSPPGTIHQYSAAVLEIGSSYGLVCVYVASGWMLAKSLEGNSICWFLIKLIMQGFLLSMEILVSSEVIYLRALLDFDYWFYSFLHCICSKKGIFLC